MKSLKLIIAILVFSFHSCLNHSRPSDFKEVQISSELLEKIESKAVQTAKPFERVNYTYDTVNGEWNERTDTIRNGFFFSGIPDARARQIFDSFFDAVRQDGNYLVLTNLDFDDNFNSLYDVVILKAKDQFEVVKMMNTEGPNFEVTNDMVLEKLRKWDKEVGFRVIVADYARVEALMKNNHSNLETFAQEIYEFCPDVIEQGYGDMSAMLEDYKENKYFWMWWD